MEDAITSRTNRYQVLPFEHNALNKVSSRLEITDRHFNLNVDVLLKNGHLAIVHMASIESITYHLYNSTFIGH